LASGVYQLPAPAFCPFIFSFLFSITYFASRLKVILVNNIGLFYAHVFVYYGTLFVGTERDLRNNNKLVSQHLACPERKGAPLTNGRLCFPLTTGSAKYWQGASDVTFNEFAAFGAS